MMNRLKKLLVRIREGMRPHVGRAGLLLLGFLIASVVFAVRSCSEPRPHDDHRATPAPSSSEQTIWTCSMHPQIRQPEPGQCPICGMDLIPVTSGDNVGASSPTRIVLSDRARALARLRTVPVRRRADASGQLRLLGRIDANETTLKTITEWTGGRIDRLHVNVTGERVRAGQVIATLYSPEVFAAHQDLLVAKRQVERMAQSPDSSRRAAAAALDAARERLRLLGVPDDELARMERQERPTRAVAIRTPFAGTVIERIATEGAYVSTGTPLYRLANLSTLWLQLDAYESDLSGVALEDSVRVMVDALPGEDFEGKVAFIDPTIDPRTRTARVRVVLDNAEGRLRPGMFAQATVATGAVADGRSPLVVPATAPLFTGRRAILYVEVRDGDRTAYEARTVRLGPRLGDFYPVVAGLSEGERVVSRGAFALDADLQIRGGASMMTSPDDSAEGVWDAAIELSAGQRGQLAPIVTAYLAVQEALAADSLSEAKAGAERLIAAIATVSFERLREAAAAWAEVSAGLGQHGRHVKMATDLEGARSGFEGLSQEVEVLLRRFGNPLDTPLNVAFCPMAVGSEGASWVQRGTEIENSYFGASMRDCGEIQHQVPAGSFLSPPADSSATRQAPAPAGGHQH